MLPEACVCIRYGCGSLCALSGKSASCLMIWRTQGRNPYASVASVRGSMASHPRRRRTQMKCGSSSRLRRQRRAGSVLSISLILCFNQNPYDAVSLVFIQNVTWMWKSILYTLEINRPSFCRQVTAWSRVELQYVYTILYMHHLLHFFR